MLCPHCKDVNLAMTDRQGIEEDNMILLPNSGLAVMTASRIFERSFKDRERD